MGPGPDLAEDHLTSLQAQLMVRGKNAADADRDPVASLRRKPPGRART